MARGFGPFQSTDEGDKALRSKKTLGALAALFLIGSTTPAFAYLDPGTASVIIQGAIGTVAAGLVLIRVYWYKLKDMFGSKSETASSGSAAMSDEGRDAGSNSDN